MGLLSNVFGGKSLKEDNNNESNNGKKYYRISSAEGILEYGLLIVHPDFVDYWREKGSHNLRSHLEAIIDNDIENIDLNSPDIKEGTNLEIIQDNEYVGFIDIGQISSPNDWAEYYFNLPIKGYGLSVEEIKLNQGSKIVNNSIEGEYEVLGPIDTSGYHAKINSFNGVYNTEDWPESERDDNHKGYIQVINEYKSWNSLEAFIEIESGEFDSSKLFFATYNNYDDEVMGENWNTILSIWYGRNKIEFTVGTGELQASHFAFGYKHSKNLTDDEFINKLNNITEQNWKDDIVDFYNKQENISLIEDVVYELKENNQLSILNFLSENLNESANKELNNMIKMYDDENDN